MFTLTTSGGRHDCNRAFARFSSDHHARSCNARHRLAQRRRPRLAARVRRPAARARLRAAHDRRPPARRAGRHALSHRPQPLLVLRPPLPPLVRRRRRRLRRALRRQRRGPWCRARRAEPRPRRRAAPRPQPLRRLRHAGAVVLARPRQRLDPRHQEHRQHVGHDLAGPAVRAGRVLGADRAQRRRSADAGRVAARRRPRAQLLGAPALRAAAALGLQLRGPLRQADDARPLCAAGRRRGPPPGRHRAAGGDDDSRLHRHRAPPRVLRAAAAAAPLAPAARARRLLGQPALAAGARHRSHRRAHRSPDRRAPLHRAGVLSVALRQRLRARRGADRRLRPLSRLRVQRLAGPGRSAAPPTPHCKGSCTAP